MSQTVVRPIANDDLAAWRVLWDGYNAFYGRLGDTALPDAITAVTWARFFDPAEPVFGLVAEVDGKVVGLAHHLYHRGTTRIEMSCYLSDLFVDPALRGRGVGRALIEGVCSAARTAGVPRVYWLTHESNAAGRLLYDGVARHQGFIVYSRDA